MLGTVGRHARALWCAAQPTRRAPPQSRRRRREELREGPHLLLVQGKKGGRKVQRQASLCLVQNSSSHTHSVRVAEQAGMHHSARQLRTCATPASLLAGAHCNNETTSVPLGWVQTRALRLGRLLGCPAPLRVSHVHVRAVQQAFVVAFSPCCAPAVVPAAHFFCSLSDRGKK